ncbi:MAG: hypothetical protein M1838_000002 [Thelocarpon superellum]|nr:MAG: hypothetical protein M1838_000002 [Thelocarpon superellum]
MEFTKHLLTLSTDVALRDVSQRLLAAKASQLSSHSQFLSDHPHLLPQLSNGVTHTLRQFNVHDQRLSELSPTTERLIRSLCERVGAAFTAINTDRGAEARVQLQAEVERLKLDLVRSGREMARLGEGVKHLEVEVAAVQQQSSEQIRALVARVQALEGRVSPLREAVSGGDGLEVQVRELQSITSAHQESLLKLDTDCEKFEDDFDGHERRFNALETTTIAHLRSDIARLATSLQHCEATGTQGVSSNHGKEELERFREEAIGQQERAREALRAAEEQTWERIRGQEEWVKEANRKLKQEHDELAQNALEQLATQGAYIDQLNAHLGLPLAFDDDPEEVEAIRAAAAAAASPEGDGNERERKRRREE